MYIRKKEKSFVPDYKREGFERKRKIKNFLLLNLGTLIIALGIHFFKYPNNFALGGVSGISVVLGEVISFATPATAAFAINIILIVLAFLLIGKSFAGKTVYSSILLSVLLLALERFAPLEQPLTDEGLLELFIAIGASALGAAILFNMQASSGGTDIIAMIIKKYTNADIGMALMISDLVIAISTFFVFDVKTGLLSSSGLILKGLIVDATINRFNRSKLFTIVTSKPKEVGDYVTNFLQRSCTRMEATGEYTGEKRSVFLCAVDLNQAAVLQKRVKELDEHAFIIVNTPSEISGRGFRSGF